MQARDWLDHLDFILGALREPWMGLRSSEYKGCGVGKCMVCERLEAFSPGLVITALLIH